MRLRIAPLLVTMGLLNEEIRDQPGFHLFEVVMGRRGSCRVPPDSGARSAAYSHSLEGSTEFATRVVGRSDRGRAFFAPLCRRLTTSGGRPELAGGPAGRARASVALLPREPNRCRPRAATPCSLAAAIWRAGLANS